MGKSPLRDKSYAFALDIVTISRYLISERKEYDLGRQLIRSGTAIGALIHEAEFGQSKADFKNKMYIALKEANETSYWLSLIKDSKVISVEQYSKLFGPCKELIAMLVATVKTLNRKQQ